LLCAYRAETVAVGAMLTIISAWCPDSEVRLSLPHARKRTSESQDTSVAVQKSASFLQRVRDADF